jgi:hypothetical protein
MCFNVIGGIKLRKKVKYGRVGDGQEERGKYGGLVECHGGRVSQHCGSVGVRGMEG